MDDDKNREHMLLLEGRLSTLRSLCVTLLYVADRDGKIDADDLLKKTLARIDQADSSLSYAEGLRLETEDMAIYLKDLRAASRLP